MAEEEVNYASVVFKNKRKQQPQAEQEEIVYSEVKVRNKTSKQSAKTNAVYSQGGKKTYKQSANTNVEEEEPVYSEVKERSQTSELSTNTNGSLITDKNDKSRRPPCLLVAAFLAVCVMLIAAIIAVCILLLQLNRDRELQDNQMALQDEIRNLTENIKRLSSENQNLIQNYSDLTVRFENLTEAYNLSELTVTNLTTEIQGLTTEKQGLTVKIQNLTTENQNLTTENQNLTTENHNLTTENQGLKTKNHQLETQSNNLTQQIQDEKTEWIQFNITQATLNFNAFCPIKYSRSECQRCQRGWIHEKSSCYAFNNHQTAGQKNWTEARGDCGGKGSDLVVIADEAEKKFVSNYEYGNRFWIGLRVVEGKWKWVDGSEVTDSLWTEQPADEGHCVVSVKADGWRSVNCSERNQWICEQAALFV